MPYLPHQMRVVDESRELNMRVEKLSAFIASPAYLAVETREAKRLSEQLGYMRSYADVLLERIECFGEV